MEGQGQIVKGWRMKLGMTREEFAAYTEIPKETIKNWEREKSKAPDYVINMLQVMIAVESQNVKGKSPERRLLKYFIEMQKK